MRGKVDVETGEIAFRTPELRHAYSDHSVGSVATGLVCPEPSLTQQSFAEEVDINTIVRRFGLTGHLPQNLRAPTSGDFSEALDFRQSMDAILRAQDTFMQLPAETRAKFGNQPAAFVEYCSDPKNYEEMGKLGLLSPEAWEKYQADAARKAAAAFDQAAQAAGYVKPDKGAK